MVLNGGEVLVLISEQKFPHSAGSGEPVESNVDADVANVLVEVSIEGLLG